VFSGFALSDPHEEVDFAKHYFGVGLGTGPHSSLFTCFMVKEYEGKIVAINGLTPDQFIRQAAAMIDSKANPDSIDYFQKFRVSSCLKMKDPDTGQEIRPCDPFSKLWKLRFSKYPLHQREPVDRGDGWAKNETKPSPAQLEILSTYGIQGATGMCYGDNAFRLLRDVNDPIWVQSYRNAE